MQNPGIEHFYTESSLLDFWLNFGLTGILILLAIFSFGISKSISNKRYYGVITIFFMSVMIISQNSSLLPPNIVILMAIFIQLEKRDLKYTLSPLK